MIITPVYRPSLCTLPHYNNVAALSGIQFKGVLDATCFLRLSFRNILNYKLGWIWKELVVANHIEWPVLYRRF